MTARIEALADGSARVHFGRGIPCPDGVSAVPPERLFVTFRPPTIGEMIDHDDPVTFVTDGERVVPVLNREVLRLWIERLITDHDMTILSRVAAPDIGRLIVEAVSGFFTQAPAKPGLSSGGSSPPASA